MKPISLSLKTVIILFLFSYCCVCTLKGNDFEIINFHVDIEILQNGSFRVKEEIDVFFFENRRGIFRTIPFRYRINGENYTIGLNYIKVTDHPFKVSRKKGVLEIRIGDPNKWITGSQKYNIEYTAVGAFLFLDEHIEFNWNITGNEWPVPIEFVSYRIQLPDHTIIPDEDIVFSSGKKGETRQDASMLKTGRYIQGRMQVSLATGEGLTVAVKLPKGYVDQPALVDKKSHGNDKLLHPFKDIFSIIPASLLALLFLAYYRFGVNIKDKDNYEIQYYPPKGMTAAEVGTFYDYIANNRDVISLIPQWGYQGLVEVSSIPDSRGQQDIYFIKKGELPVHTPEYEKILWNGLFESRSQVFLSDLQHKFYSVLSATKRALHREVTEPRLYNREAMAYFKSNWNLVLFIGFFIGGTLLMILKGWILSGILTILIGFAILVFRFLPPRFSEEGRELHQKMVGLKKFLENPPAEDIARLTEKDPGYLDFIYPYVVAFGIDKSWSIVMAKQGVTNYAPAWFILADSSGRRSTGNYTTFTDAFNVAVINSVFSSVPSSQGGSGGFGSSSGGGFGGGGGGSW